MEKSDKYEILYVIHWIGKEEENTSPNEGSQRYCLKINKGRYFLHAGHGSREV
jgi:hypothetical protein